MGLREKLADILHRLPMHALQLHNHRAAADYELHFLQILRPLQATVEDLPVERSAEGIHRSLVINNEDDSELRERWGRQREENEAEKAVSRPGRSQIVQKDRFDGDRGERCELWQIQFRIWGV